MATVTRYARACALAFTPADVRRISEALRITLRQGPAAIEQCLEFSTRNKAVTILYTNLVRCKGLLKEEPGFDWAWSVWGEAYRLNAIHQTRLRNELKRLTDKIDMRALMAIKGLAVGPAYPRPYQRHLNDVDIFCETPEAAYHLASQLLSEGYQIGEAEPPWIKRLDPRLCERWGVRPAYFGQINMVRVDAELTCRLDIHFSLYSISHTPVLGVDLARGAQLSPDGVPPLMTPRPENSVLILVAHLLSQGAVLVKDLNDLAVLARQSLDWDYIEARAYQAGVEGVLAAALRTASALLGYDVPVLKYNRVVAGLLPAFEVRWLHRALLNAFCTWQFERRHFGLRDALHHSRECLSYYARHLHPTVVEGTGADHRRRRYALPARLENLRRTECLRLLPPQLLNPDLREAAFAVPDALVDKFWVSSLGDADARYLRSRTDPNVAVFITHGQGLFPTLTYKFERQSLEAVVDMFGRRAAHSYQ